MFSRYYAHYKKETHGSQQQRRHDVNDLLFYSFSVVVIFFVCVFLHFQFVLISLVRATVAAKLEILFVGFLILFFKCLLLLYVCELLLR